MIAASEIRIGNWLRYTIDEMAYNNKYRITEDKLVQVDSISYDHLLEKQLPDSYCINHSSRNYFFPIPLTEEILVKCGFESNPYQDRYEYKGIDVEHCAIRNMFWIEKCPHIKYLHQLQNLYFALTNEELNYKP